MIILSIPFKKDIQIPNSYSGWKEYRLDYNLNPESFDKELIDDETIITIRDPKEGGINPYPILKKMALYINYIKGTNCLVDLELENQQFAVEIPSDNLILSWHCFTDNWKAEQVKRKIEQAISLKPSFVKIALNISHYSQFIQISEILNSFDFPIIFAGMGLLGKQSRILYNHLNSKATYIGLEDNPTASGQLSLAEAEIYNLIKHNANTKIGGLIGGEQVYHSLGLKYYNSYFKQNGHNAVYLPLPVCNLDEFLKWEKTAKDRIYGFSITMPFKTELSHAWKASESNINLHLPKLNRSYNTDKLALQKALDQLHIRRNDNILIYGSGATAEMALQVLEKYSNVYLSSRNKQKEKQLTSKYSRISCNVRTKFDLIINCTPIGMKGEDFLEVTELELAAKYIDLPYSNKETRLIEFCSSNKISFVDGEKFWKWQADKQLKEFLKALRK